MRSASRSAARTSSRAFDVASAMLGGGSCRGGGASCSKSNAAPGAPGAALGDKLVLGVSAANHDRLGLLELAHLGDDATLGLLDDAPELRRLVLDLLEQHLGGALRHVRDDLVAHLL